MYKGLPQSGFYCACKGKRLTRVVGWRQAPHHAARGSLCPAGQCSVWRDPTPACDPSGPGPAVAHWNTGQHIKVQFSSIPWPTWSLGRHEGQFSRDPFPVFFCRRPMWAVLAWAEMSTLCCCPPSISCTDNRVTHPPRCPEGWFWKGCHGEWNVLTMQVSASWQLPEEVPVDPQGSWSCSTPSRCSCAPSKRCKEASSCIWFQNPGSFFQSHQVESMSHSHRGRWRWQETWKAWTCLRSWWCCTARSCLAWPISIAAIAEATLLWLSADQGCSQVLQIGHLL